MRTSTSGAVVVIVLVCCQQSQTIVGVLFGYIQLFIDWLPSITVLIFWFHFNLTLKLTEPLFFTCPIPSPPNIDLDLLKIILVHTFDRGLN